MQAHEEALSASCKNAQCKNEQKRGAIPVTLRMGLMSDKAPEHFAGQACGVLLFGTVVIGALMAVYFWVGMRTVNPAADTGRGICASCAAPRQVPGGIAI